MKKNFRKTGFTLTEIMVVVAIIALLAAIAIPSIKKARATSQANACIHNLRQIDNADNQFSMDHAMPAGSNLNYPDDLTNYIKLNSAGLLPKCPAGDTYALSFVAELPSCSLSNTVTPNHILP